MTKKLATIVFTQEEISALADYAASQSRARTFAVERDARNVLNVRNPDGRFIGLAPPRKSPKPQASRPQT